MWNTGYSLNAKKVTETLGFVDMKQICYCLAHAIMRHIEFSRGFYFLVDLQQSIQQNQQKEDDLEFSYKLGELKIDIPSREKMPRLVLTSEQIEKENDFEALK